jgi:hypothetical protein
VFEDSHEEGGPESEFGNSCWDWCFRGAETDSIGLTTEDTEGTEINQGGGM